ncbi:EamA domain-containing membrane protein RarD [Arboricoccus pini]|uniref:EamA domain-containing membrane protein RarD n=1 Tax=Arboricoccus pini TaxID=1963835 RepID=A0A212RC69_9PROT|nr:DMT family transporter [Arboricoccus pini]SNB69867.1 EamA domain-containing membrane protein RarD [Arboricoccus pini]
MVARPALAVARAPELTGILLTLVAMGMFGTMDGLSKALVQSYPPQLVLWLRYLMALPLVILALAPRHPLVAMRQTRAFKLQLLRCLFLIVETGLVITAFKTLPLANAHSIFAVTPLVVTALSFFFLGEQVGWRRWTAVAIGFVGVLIILRPGLMPLGRDMAFIVVAMLLYATYMVLTRLVARVDAADTSYLLQSILMVLMLSLMGPFFLTPIALRHIPLLVLLGVLGAAGHYFLVQALALAPAVVVQPFTYTLLLWAVGIGYLFFGDLPDVWTGVGASLVVGAGLYAAWREHRRRAIPA